MSSAPVELDNLEALKCLNQLPLSASASAPPYSVVDTQPTFTAGIFVFNLPIFRLFCNFFPDQPSLPAPVVVQPPEVSVGNKLPEFQRYRQQVICTSCRQQVVTKTEHRISSGTWCMCCVVFFVGGFICCFVPFLMKSCKDVVHLCPKCNAEIGRKALI